MAIFDSGGGMSLVKMLFYLLILSIVVIGIVVFVIKHKKKEEMMSGRPRYPRDWPPQKEVFTKDARHQGYFKTTGREVIANKRLSGAVRIGRLYPTVELFRYVPEIWPLTRLRMWVLRNTTSEVWIPYPKIFTHSAVLGATGKGKSVSFALPQIIYGAMEENTAYFAIDVKSPQFSRMFSQLYKNAGKDVYLFDPWSIEQTLAFEPLWRASDDVLNEISEVIATYSTSGEGGGGGNSEFFNLAAQRVMRGLVELAQFWPRRYCNLPNVQQLVVAGYQKVEEAFKQAERLQPTAEDVLAAAAIVVPASIEDLRRVPRDLESDIAKALDVLERAGYVVGRLTRRMRRYYLQRMEGTLPEDQFLQAERAYEMEVRGECERRRAQLEKLIEGQGEYLDMPPETKGSVMSTLTNRISWFKDSNVSRAFSRDELDIRKIVEKPCLFLVGAPMAKLNVGSLFVASIMTNLAITAVFQRGAQIEAGEKGVWKGGTKLILDEFPQLNIRKASQALATFRGFRGALFMIYQDRGQLKKLYGEDFTNIEANCIHQVILQGSHMDSAEFYAKSMGEVMIPQVSETGGDGDTPKNIQKSMQRVPLLEPKDLRYGVLNGEIKDKLAFSVGSETPPFPFIPVPYWEDPLIRKVMKLKLTVNRSGPFWDWEDHWGVDNEDEGKYVHRRTRNRRDTANDPVAHRLDDPFGQYVDFLIGRPRERVIRDGKEVIEIVYDQLDVPVLDLPVILGMTGTVPVPLGMGSASHVHSSPPAPGAPPRAGGASATPVARSKRNQASSAVPVYPKDFGVFVKQDYGLPGKPVSRVPVSGGDLQDRIQGLHTSEEES